MTRRDTHLDAMPGHLGAAYFENLHGRASTADVTRAVDPVAQQFGEESPRGEPTTRRPYRGPQHHGRWHSRGVPPPE